MVHPEGVEPPRLAAQEPESCVSANSTTGAQKRRHVARTPAARQAAVRCKSSPCGTPETGRTRATAPAVLRIPGPCCLRPSSSRLETARVEVREFRRTADYADFADIVAAHNNQQRARDRANLPRPIIRGYPRNPRLEFYLARAQSQNGSRRHRLTFSAKSIIE